MTELSPKSKVSPKVAVIALKVPQIALIKPISAEEKVNRLISCENPQRITNLIIMDTNKKRSAGVLMFQFATMEYYAKRYGLRTEFTKADWLNPSLQRETAIRMLKENPANILHWRNCARIKNLLAQK